MRVQIIGGAGYLGSAVAQFLEIKGVEVSVMDTGWFGVPESIAAGEYYPHDYGQLAWNQDVGADAVIIFAAHSSVPMCESDPNGAFRNNIKNFLPVLRACEKYRRRLIYASSSAVYQHITDAHEFDALPQPCDHLTLTKSTIDAYAMLSDADFYGLRLGSVCGKSPNFRTDLMLNAMVKRAKNGEPIRVSNEDSRRPILVLDDLGPCIYNILLGGDRRGIYNVSSFNATVGEIAHAVSERYSQPIQRVAGRPTYSFTLNTTKFRHIYGINFSDINHALRSAEEGVLGGGQGRERCPVEYGL